MQNWCYAGLDKHFGYNGNEIARSRTQFVRLHVIVGRKNAFVAFVCLSLPCLDSHRSIRGQSRADWFDKEPFKIFGSMSVAITRYVVVRGAIALLEHRLDVGSVASPRFGEFACEICPRRFYLRLTVQYERARRIWSPEYGLIKDRR